MALLWSHDVFCEHTSFEIKAATQVKTTAAIWTFPRKKKSGNGSEISRNIPLSSSFFLHSCRQDQDWKPNKGCCCSYFFPNHFLPCHPQFHSSHGLSLFQERERARVILAMTWYISSRVIGHSAFYNPWHKPKWWRWRGEEERDGWGKYDD